MTSTRSVSVIVPCLNDQAALWECLERLLPPIPSPADSHAMEIIVADASPDDACADVAREFGVTLKRCKTRGRGQQLNAGAAHATGDVLLFNHADTQLTCQHVAAVVDCLNLSQETVGGAFYRDIAWQYPRLAWMDPWLVRPFSRRFGILYGDQSVFVRRDVFEGMKGFADIPIMEDIDFSARLRRMGKVALVDPPVRTSMRRFQRRGYWRSKLQNLTVIQLWRLGLITPEQIYGWYYGDNV